MALSPIPPGPLGDAVPAYIWTGRTIIAVGPGSRHIIAGDMAIYNPVNNRWRSLPASPGHPTLSVTPVWTGAELLWLYDNAQLQLFHR